MLVNEGLIHLHTKRPILGTVRVGPNQDVVLRSRKKVATGIGGTSVSTIVWSNVTKVVLNEGAGRGEVNLMMAE